MTPDRTPATGPAGDRLFSRRFDVDRELVRRCLAACEPLVLEALDVHAQRHLWRGELPVYPVMTTPQNNGGWGHLMPVWFKPQERPIPFYALQNWGVFALAYARSFGDSEEARQLAAQFFTVENVVRVVVGTNLQLPFLPGTQGRGRFFRHGMLPFTLSILWLEEAARDAWFRLHELSARRFIAAHGLHTCEDPIEVLTGLEYDIFARLERNWVVEDEDVAAFLAAGDGSERARPLLHLYLDMFGAIGLGVSALAGHYREKPLPAWRAWVPPELMMPYRLFDYGMAAIRAFIARSAVDL